MGRGATRKTVEFFANCGVRVLTLFAFSSENWQRPRAEVDALLNLFVAAIEDELPELREKGIRLRFIGQRDEFPGELQERMAVAEAETSDNDTMTLVVALGYGGRWDILQAALRWVRESAPAEPEPEAFDDFLSTSGLPEVDLLIRTGGEQRISNFLLWQAAYAEFCFLDVLWPDVGEHELQDALDCYSHRQRRFGRTSSQVAVADA